MPRWVPPVLFAGGLLVVAILSNHSSQTTTPEGLGVVGDAGSYSRILAQASALSSQALQKYHEGEPLSETDIQNIRSAVKMIDAANLYKPNAAAPFFLSGTAHAALQDHSVAIERFRQGIVNVGKDHSAALYQAVVDAHYEISRSLYALGQYGGAYNEASAAAEEIPTSPEYLIARAKAALQVHKEEVAKDEVAAALAIDPTYAPAKLLGDYLHVSPAHKAH